MKLKISEKIKKYRKERDMTQDSLAQVLGVTPQSISKWECGDGYPDITLLPSIANYFEVTVDELIGNDEISSKEDVKKNYFDKLREIDDNEKIELGIQYCLRYPHNWHIITSLMNHIARSTRDMIKKYRPLVIEICERLLKECADSVMRRNAVRSMCMICDENEIGSWLKRDSGYWYQERCEVYEERYQLLGDEKKYKEWHSAGNVMRTACLLSRFNSHRDHTEKDIENISWNQMYLNFLDGMVNLKDTDVIPDGWIPEYYIAYVYLSEAFFGMSEKELGYQYLDKALKLNDRWNQILENAALDLGNNMFFGETKLIKNNWHIMLPCGEKIFIRGKLYQINNLHHIISDPMRKNFDCVRNEEKWNEILKQANDLL